MTYIYHTNGNKQALPWMDGWIRSPVNGVMTSVMALLLTGYMDYVRIASLQFLICHSYCICMGSINWNNSITVLSCIHETGRRFN